MSESISVLPSLNFSQPLRGVEPQVLSEHSPYGSMSTDDGGGGSSNDLLEKETGNFVRVSRGGTKKTGESNNIYLTIFTLPLSKQKEELVNFVVLSKRIFSAIYPFCAVDT